MTDIVERLRKGADYAHDTEVMEEAATEIVLLRNGLQFADVHAAKIEGLLLGTIKENERLRALLEEFTCDCAEDEVCLGECMHKHAREALKQEKKLNNV